MAPDIIDLAKAIQLALAPVLLLTGIGALITVMTGRLARIIDRDRLSLGCVHPVNQTSGESGSQSRFHRLEPILLLYRLDGSLLPKLDDYRARHAQRVPKHLDDRFQNFIPRVQSLKRFG